MLGEASTQAYRVLMSVYLPAKAVDYMGPCMGRDLAWSKMTERERASSRQHTRAGARAFVTATVNSQSGSGASVGAMHGPWGRGRRRTPKNKKRRVSKL